MANPAPPGVFQAVLHLGFQQTGWTERYFLTEGSLGAAQQYGSILAYLRTYFFGVGVEIDQGYVADASGTNRSLPIQWTNPLKCPYATGVGPPNDSVAGFMYKLGRTFNKNGVSDGWFENRILRGVPDNWINGQRPAIVVPLGGGTGLIPNVTYPAQNWNSLPLPGVLTANLAGANLFIQFLAQRTQYVSFPYTAVQTAIGPWMWATFYKIAVRRTGKRYRIPKGRYAKAI